MRYEYLFLFTLFLCMSTWSINSTAGYDYIFVNSFEALCQSDADQDRLSDCDEINNGTDLRDPDTDRDGLNDGDEVLGTLAGLDLPAFGVNPLHKDILIEYDWFEDSSECGFHSHRPTIAVVDGVQTAFSNSPVMNPDGLTGVHVIQDYGQGGIFTGGNLINDLDGNILGDVFGEEFQSYESANFSSQRLGYFHYAIMAHRYNINGNTGSSGSGAIAGHDFMVTLYCNYDNNIYVRNTIIHELGHNLSLLHGGNTYCNYKPNYNSIMNYKYQFLGLDTNCDSLPDGNAVSYSTGGRRNLNENNLDENVGVCQPQSVPIDWNHDSSIESSVSVDINSEDTDENTFCGGQLTTLRDYNDWGNLIFGAVSPNFFGGGVPPQAAICATPP